MKLVMLALLPPAFVALAGYTIIWAVEPEYLRERAGIVLPLLFGMAMAFGELTAWLGRAG